MSPQSRALYQILLNSSSPLSVVELADKLHIIPNTVYRLLKPLIDMGMVTEIHQYPKVFSALPIDQGLSLFLLHQHDWFSRQFSQRSKTKLSKGTNIIPESKQIALSFIQSRDELMDLSSGEIDHAKHSIDLLRSGGEIPASVMLSLVEAKKRNVTTRMLIQDYSAANASQVDNWKQNGILVKKTTLRHVRLMLYDSSVVYFMSYRNEDSVKDLGMKITYPPFATILSQLFHEWWEKGGKV